MRGLITAIRTLTIFPVPGKDADDLSDSLFFFPLVGALLGLVMALVGWCVSSLLGWPSGAGAVCVAFSVLMTGGIHPDGLADVFDALGCSTRERRLAVMKDPHVGSYGIIAVVVFLMLKYVAFTRLCELERYWWIILPYVISRTVQVEIAACLPYAREGEGTGRRFVEGATGWHFVGACILAGLLCFAVAGWYGVVLLILSCAIGLILVRWIRHEFGGATGDLLGMSSELAETFVLFVSALLGGL